jgi:hypothetical protein
MTEQPIHLAQIGQIAVPVTDLCREPSRFTATLSA